ncbi:hypothetical protein SNE40_009058 [Patella caerulea]|uniref:Phosphatidylinositol N-acetylglucosaminyltransferase subunit H conserved domain-containing protein n=1 Tax=Patella caerulea TaxID=87958 RepID=A0AAN8JVS9_PATCE
MDKISEQKPFYLWMIAVFLALVLFYKLYTKVSAEIFLVLPSIGLQVQTKYLFGSISTQFMDISKIKDVIINEAISLQSVIFYLAVLLKEEKSENLQSIYPLFIHSWPNLCILKKIYSITQRKLIMTSPTAKLKQS